jgi:putative hemolysin
VLKLMGQGDLKEPEVTESEILALIGHGKRTGVLTKLEADLVLRTLKAGDVMVREVMTHRTDIVWVDRAMTLREFIEFNARQHFSRFPVRGADHDDVLGIVSVKDVMHAAVLGKLKPDEPVSKVMRSPLIVPETKEILPLVVAMRDQDRNVAVVIDEFGGVAGLVTFKQLVSEVMGQRETKETADRIRWVETNVVEVDATLRVDEANERLGMKIPEGDYDTLAGFVMAQLGHVPRKGESVTHDGVELKVVSMDGHQVETIRVAVPQ